MCYCILNRNVEKSIKINRNELYLLQKKFDCIDIPLILFSVLDKTYSPDSDLYPHNLSTILLCTPAKLP